MRTRADCAIAELTSSQRQHVILEANVTLAQHLIPSEAVMSLAMEPRPLTLVEARTLTLVEARPLTLVEARPLPTSESWDYN